MMLDRAAVILGYDPPTSKIETRGECKRCIFYFCLSGANQVVDFKCAGVISNCVRMATEAAVYQGYLCLSVNRCIEIKDSHRDAYLFAKERVAAVSSDVVALGNAGSSICSYFDSTSRGVMWGLAYGRRHKRGQGVPGAP
jgi:hypothetical protein